MLSDHVKRYYGQVAQIIHTLIEHWFHNQDHYLSTPTPLPPSLTTELVLRV